MERSTGAKEGVEEGVDFFAPFDLPSGLESLLLYELGSVGGLLDFHSGISKVLQKMQAFEGRAFHILQPCASRFQASRVVSGFLKVLDGIAKFGRVLPI